jgi:hypothetical protein
MTLTSIGGIMGEEGGMMTIPQISRHYELQSQRKIYIFQKIDPRENETMSQGFPWIQYATLMTKAISFVISQLHCRRHKRV